MENSTSQINNPTNEIVLLERLFNGVQTANNDQTSLISLFDYADFVAQNSSLKIITDELEQQKEKAYKNYYKLKKETLDELRDSEKKILKIISKNKLENPELDDTIKKLKEFEKTRVNNQENYEFNFETYLYDICTDLIKNNNEKLIKEFIENKIINSVERTFVFSTTLSLFHREKDRIEQIGQMEVWPCWYAIKFIPEISKLIFSDIMNSPFTLPLEETKYFVEFVHLKEGINGKNTYSSISKDLSKYKHCLARLHNYFIMKLSEIRQPTRELKSNKLAFYPTDGTAEYKGTSYTFRIGTKGLELLNFLNNSKNTPLEPRFFQERCNERIRIEKHKFKEEKDILDTINNIKTKLKVKKGEYFPIYKKGNNFIWEEK